MDRIRPGSWFTRGESGLANDVIHGARPIGARQARLARSSQAADTTGPPALCILRRACLSCQPVPRRIAISWLLLNLPCPGTSHRAFVGASDPDDLKIRYRVIVGVRMMLSGAPPQDAAKQDGDQAVIRVLDVPGRAESEASAAARPSNRCSEIFLSQYRRRDWSRFHWE